MKESTIYCLPLQQIDAAPTELSSDDDEYEVATIGLGIVAGIEYWLC